MATNVLDAQEISDEELIGISKEQGGIERGFRFLRISLVPGIVGLCEKAGTTGGIELRNGPVLAGVSPGGASGSHATGQHGADAS